MFDRDEGGVSNWGEVKKLTAGDGAATDTFGRSVSVSGCKPSAEFGQIGPMI